MENNTHLQEIAAEFPELSTADAKFVSMNDAWRRLLRFPWRDVKDKDGNQAYRSLEHFLEFCSRNASCAGNAIAAKKLLNVIQGKERLDEAKFAKALGEETISVDLTTQGSALEFFGPLNG